MSTSAERSITIDGTPVSIDDIIAVARGNATVRISSSQSFVSTIERSRILLMNALENGTPVYGVNTGYGKSCGKRIAMEVAVKNGLNLIRFHGCGTGEPLGIPETRAAMMTRILCFARGYSGVSIQLIQRLADFLNAGITPVVPSEGSVGASGDLTPMSYIAAAIMGDGEVFYQGSRMPSAMAHFRAGLNPLEFSPKEPLAIMNGTSAMTGIGIMVMDRARRILRASIAATALAVHALKGNTHHYDPVIAKAKPHPGQDLVARTIARLLEANVDEKSLAAQTPETLQDPYSIRCVPQILGVLHDAIEWTNRWLEIEANSANDNPLIDPETGRVLMGGNFYGGHVVFAMDALKSAIASAADMSDRQIALMVDPYMNRGLPADLVGADKNEIMYNHGFKAMSIASSALAAEALKLTMPAASFSRSTESHNQDKVSMGTISARDAARICDLTEKVTAIHLLASAQACELRGAIDTRPRIAAAIKTVRTIADSVTIDRPMDRDIAAIAAEIRNGELPSKLLENA